MQETRTAMHAVTEIQKHSSSDFQLFPSPPTARIWLLVFKWHKTSFFFGLGISEDWGSEIFALSVNSPAAYQGCFKTEISKSKGQMRYVSLHNTWQGTGQGTVFAALTPILLAALPSAQQSSLPPAEVKPKRCQRTCEGLLRQKKVLQSHAKHTRWLNKGGEALEWADHISAPSCSLASCSAVSITRFCGCFCLSDSTTHQRPARHRQ